MAGNTDGQKRLQLTQNECTEQTEERNPSRFLDVEVEFEGRARGATEFASSRTAAFVDADDDWKPLSASRGGYGSKGSTACCNCTATLPTTQQQAVLQELPWPAFSDNFAYIIQVYIIANMSSHGIINITWLWIDVPANWTKDTYRASLGKPIVPIVVERRSLHMEEDFISMDRRKTLPRKTVMHINEEKTDEGTNGA